MAAPGAPWHPSKDVWCKLYEAHGFHDVLQFGKMMILGPTISGMFPYRSQHDTVRSHSELRQQRSIRVGYG